jgi:hypothetical protein
MEVSWVIVGVAVGVCETLRSDILVPSSGRCTPKVQHAVLITLPGEMIPQHSRGQDARLPNALVKSDIQICSPANDVWLRCGNVQAFIPTSYILNL